MRAGSLFSGIGGLDLGLQRAGFEIAWQVEIDEWCQLLLSLRWPEVTKHRDIRECGRHNLSWVDVIVGGFPCQDISSAGKRAGIEGERSGLWREQARIIEEIRPRYVLIENVAALLYATKRPDGTRREAAITTVLRDLAAIGYDAVWRVCSAAEFGAPHLRRRVFIVAYSPGPGQQERIYTERLHTELDPSGPDVADANRAKRRASAKGRDERDGTDARRQETAGRLTALRKDGRGWAMADANQAGLQERNGRAGARGPRARADECGQRDAQSRMGRIFDGLPYWLDGHQQRWPAGPGEEQYEWEPARVIQGKLPHRVARLKGLGNAALPQIAEAIGYGIRWHAELEVE